MGETPNIQVHARDGSSSTCSYCKGACDESDAGVTCGGCQAAYHPECLDELGACATPGCSQPRAGKPSAPGVRRISVPGVRCCHRPTTEGSIVVCDGCAARWHATCAGATAFFAGGRLGACCAGRGFSVERGPARARDHGPRVGSRRSCTSCGTTFTVEARRRFSPLCGGCRLRSNLLGLAIVVAAFVGYVVLIALNGR